MRRFYFLLLSATLLPCCHAQDHSITTHTLPKPVKTGHSKMIRTQGMVSGNVGCQLMDKNGNLWFGTGGEGIYRYDGKTFVNFTTADDLCSNHVNAIIQDKAGNIVFGTNSGICRFDGRVFANLTADADASKQHICSLLEDQEGNLWFGTMNDGIYRYDGKIFVNYLNKNDQFFNLNNHNQLVLDMLQDKSGNIWFSSWNGGGIWLYDGQGFKNFLPSPDYYTSNEDGRNRTSIDLRTLYQHSGDYISDDMIFSLATDKAGNLWLGTRNHGACRYDGKSFTVFGEEKGFANTAVYAILEDQKGNMWFTTENSGVWRYNGKTFKNFTTEDGLVNDSVFSAMEDASGHLWFGTRGFGLSHYDGNTFTTFSE